MPQHSQLAELSTRMAEALADLGNITRAYGEDFAAMPAGQRERAERIQRQVRKLDDEIEAVEERERKLEAVRAASSDSRNVEPVSATYRSAPVGSTGRRANPWADLGTDVTRSDTMAGLAARAHDAIERMDESVGHDGRELLANVLRSDNSMDAAAYVLATTDPAYTSAFSKAIRADHGYRMWTADEQLAFQRVETSRAALGLGAGGGSYIVPTPLDPMIQLTSAAGTTNPLRALARREVTTSATWNGSTSPGITATWTAENIAMTEGNPTISQVTVTPDKLTTWITASYELDMDSNLAAQLPGLIGDAFDVAEATAFATGSGTPPTPEGIVTAVAANAPSTVTATTRGAFTSASLVDVFALDNALPARARRGRVAWIGSRTILNIVRQMSPSAAGSAFWATLADFTPARLLDSPVYEVSAMTAATTSGSSLLILGDFSHLLVVDRLGTTVERVANVVDGSGIPTGTRGWVAHRRVGTAITDPSAFRRLLA